MQGQLSLIYAIFITSPAPSWLAINYKFHSWELAIHKERFFLKNAVGYGFNQFFMDIPSFWYIICLYSLTKSYLSPKNN